MTEALADSGKPFVYISGSSIYGDTGPDAPADEYAPLHPPASASRLLVYEEIVRKSAEKDVRGIVIRGAGILYGRGGGATPTFWLNDTRRHNTARYIGDGLQRWSAVHVDDLATLVTYAVERAPASSVFNAVTEVITLRDAAEVVAQATGATGGTMSISEADVREEWGTFFTHLLARNLWLSSARAEQVLDWHRAAPSFSDDLRYGSYQGARA